MFINLMVTVGLVFLATYPPILPYVNNTPRYPWRDVAAAAVLTIFCMQMPWVVSPGVQIDLRNIPLGLIGWLFGWKASAIVSVTAIAFRLWMGGPGAMPSLIYLAFCTAVVPFFTGRPRNILTLAAMGLVYSLGFYVVLQLFLPLPADFGPFSPLWVVITAIFVLSFWLVNAAIEHVHEKRLLQKALADELRSKEAVLELIPHGILLMGQQGEVTDANRAARAMLDGGRVPSEVLSHPEVASALAERRPIHGCQVTRRSDEHGECIVLVSAVPLEHGGTVLGLENVTGIIAAEREEARRSRLELLGRLAAMAAHEIRNPLTTIKGFLQLWAQRMEFAQHHSALHLVQGEVEHINRVVSDFLLLSANRPPANSQFRLDQLLQELLAAMQVQFPGSGVTVRLAGEAALTVEADEKSVKQILHNLVINAYEALGAGGELVITRSSPEGHLVIEVSDSGPGISPDMLPLVFTPYLTTKPTGTGLGLAISHKLAADLGGRLEVDSEVGRGCTFRLTLPGQSVDPKEERQEAS